MLIIYTGKGKGKTTAALGSACRALGQGKRVLMIQFIKSPEWKSGEDYFFQKFQFAGWRTNSKFQILKAGLGFISILGDKKPISAHGQAAKKALAFARGAIAGGKYDMIVLDEINAAVDLKLLKASDALKVLKQTPKEMILIFTGRGAPKSFIRKADLVTEMREVKHPFQKGKRALPGVEF